MDLVGLEGLLLSEAEGLVDFNSEIFEFLSELVCGNMISISAKSTVFKI